MSDKNGIARPQTPGQDDAGEPGNGNSNGVAQHHPPPDQIIYGEVLRDGPGPIPAGEPGHPGPTGLDPRRAGGKEP